ncbi:MAG: GGDEF domain-containing protein [Schwartzia sp.]|nr:GGDEF domain-containing protein [Schwartzia sp. (in: firmicutes)]
MKQRSYLIERPEAVAASLEEVRAGVASYGEYTGMLIVVQAGYGESQLLSELLEPLRRDYPGAVVIGSLTGVRVMDGRLVHKGAVLTLRLFESSRVEAMALDHEKLRIEEMGRQFLDRLREIRQVAAVELIFSDIRLNMVPFLELASQADPSIPFFGRVANDSGLGADGPLHINGQTVASGIVAIFFSGPALHVTIHQSFGWEPLGYGQNITDMEPPYTVRQFNHQPAIKLYEKYLGMGKNEDIVLDTLTFPLYVQRDDLIIARHPIAARDDGAIVFSGVLREGDKVRLAYANPGFIMASAANLWEEMAAFRPQGVFVVSCYARWLLLRGDVEQELAAGRGVFPAAGLYSSGELVRHKGELLICNMTLVLAGMREGDREAMPPVEISHQAPNFSNQSRILHRLVHFVRAVSAELEESNRSLAWLAQRDRMTELLNRGEIEALLARSLALEAEAMPVFSVLMVDVDDFKTINDTYGHETGDEALKGVANVLKQSIRQNDAAGRWGGDEFLVILVKTRLEVARSVAQRIQQSMSNLHVLPDGKRITLSIGVTESAMGDTPLTLFHRVDQALYQSKRIKGKNQISAIDPAVNPFA